MCAQRLGKSVAMCSDPCSCARRVDLDVLAENNNKDKFSFVILCYHSFVFMGYLSIFG